MEIGQYLPTSNFQIHVDATDAQYPLTIDPYLTPVILTNSVGANEDCLGNSVAISGVGSTIVAGAYVFVKSGSWATTSTPAATLGNTSGGSGDQLGYAVAISSDGSIIVTGAFGVSSYKGAAYVFVQPGGGWSGSITAPTTMLTNAGGANYDYLGYAVAISPNTTAIVAGAYRVLSYKGAAYVFAKDPTAVTLSSLRAQPGFDLGAWLRQFLGLAQDH